MVRPGSNRMTRASGTGAGLSPALATKPDRAAATLAPDTEDASAAATRRAARFNMLVLCAPVYAETWTERKRLPMVNGQDSLGTCFDEGCSLSAGARRTSWAIFLPSFSTNVRTTPLPAFTSAAVAADFPP